MEFLNPNDVVTGHERLTEIFGRWPSFHDSEVISIRLERRGRDQWEGPVAYVSVHMFEGYREAERSAEVKWRNHTIVTFRFATVVDMSLRDSISRTRSRISHSRLNGRKIETSPGWVRRTALTSARPLAWAFRSSAVPWILTRWSEPARRECFA